MKRLILSVLAVFAIAAAVVGCTSGSTPSADPTPMPTYTQAPTATPTPTPSSNTELQGTWTWTGVGMAFTFSGNNWTLTATSAATLESIQESGTFTLDSTANPKTIDLYTTSFPTAPELVGTTSLGIYLLSGTNLTVAIAGNPGDARPTAFTEGNPVFIKQ